MVLITSFLFFFLSLPLSLHAEEGCNLLSPNEIDFSQTSGAIEGLAPPTEDEYAKVGVVRSGPCKDFAIIRLVASGEGDCLEEQVYTALGEDTLSDCGAGSPCRASVEGYAAIGPQVSYVLKNLGNPSTTIFSFLQSAKEDTKSKPSGLFVAETLETQKPRPLRLTSPVHCAPVEQSFEDFTKTCTSISNLSSDVKACEFFAFSKKDDKSYVAYRGIGPLNLNGYTRLIKKPYSYDEKLYKPFTSAEIQYGYEAFALSDEATAESLLKDAKAALTKQKNAEAAKALKALSNLKAAEYLQMKPILLVKDPLGRWAQYSKIVYSVPN